MGSPYSTLRDAVCNGDLETLRSSLDNGVDPNYQLDHVNLIHVASVKGHSDLVRLLVERGADVNRRDFFGDAPFYGAGFFKNWFHLGCIMNSMDPEKPTPGPDTFPRDMTPLHWAALAGRTDVVRILSSCCNTLVHDWYGRTAIEIARKQGFEEIVQILSQQNIVELENLVKEFENLPVARKTGGRFVVDDNIWKINRDLAISSLREIILLFKEYPKVIDWSAKYSTKKTFTFGGAVQNDSGNGRTIACASIDGMWLGTEFYSRPLESFREMARRNQDSNWHVRSNIPELKTIRHEFGHVLQKLYQQVMATKNSTFKQYPLFFEQIKKDLTDIQKLRGWDMSVREMSTYGGSNPQEWFAESFANSRNILDERPFDFGNDPRLTPEEREREQKTINEARIVGEYAIRIARETFD